NFRLSENAYVFVAHVGPGGDVKVLFPTSPDDDGLVEGGRTYGIPEFSAGRSPDYAARYAFSSYNYLPMAARTNSYDGGAGYIFVIASWRPMRFDRLSSKGEWDFYDISDTYYLRDPR